MSIFMKQLEAKYFTSEGIVKRKMFILYNLLVIACSILFIFLFTGLYYFLPNIENYFYELHSAFTIIPIKVILICCFICFGIISFMVSLPMNFMIIRRLHDLHRRELWIILSVMPIPINLIFLLYLFFKKGKSINFYRQNL